ncbi:uncharacterized protein LOC119560777 [Drosophila subpulchrella]|uniref:uncharacterized protein LOC119560777 n=1 Tax=Drosophila subpulchrella TaxID=1486046 RepID=UPI0018A15485|nr:uncharacterized protein LOC119560777 [Drosophila subpulchrella]
MFSNSIFTLIYMCFCTFFVYSQNNSLKICDDYIKSTASLNDNDINNAMSEDLLFVKTNHQIFKRICDTNSGRWIPDLVDCKTTISINKHCPDKLYEIRSHSKALLWLKISNEVPAYNEGFCYGSNIIIPTDLTSKEIFKITKFLIKKKINEHWLPTRRNNNIIIQFKNKSDEHCLKHILNNPNMFNSKNVVVAVPCNIFINAVCIFKSELLSRTGCPNGFGALTYRPHVCFGIDWKKKKHRLFHLKKYLKNRNFLRKIFAKYVTEKKQKDFFKIDCFSGTFGDEYTILMNPFEIIKMVGKMVASIPSQGHKFVIRWNVSCIRHACQNNLCNPLSIDSKVTGKKLRSLIKSRTSNSNLDELFVHYVRIVNFECKKKMFVIHWVYIAASFRTSEVKAEQIGDDNIYDDFQIPTFSIQVKHFKIVLKKLFVHLSKNSTALIRKANLCFPERLFSKNDMKNQWILTRSGKLPRTKRICLKKNVMPFTRLCKGDLSGAFWRKLRKLIVCKKTNKVTKTFHDLWKSTTQSSSPETVLRNVKDIITKNKKILVPVDILLISNIIQITLKNILENKLYWVTFEGFLKWRIVFADILNTYNAIISIDFSVLRRSAKINATNKLLESFERSVDTISTKLFVTHTDIVEEDFGLEVESETIDYDDIGVSVHISKYILYFLINPLIANVSGIALIKNKKSGEIYQQLKGSFKNEHYRFLQTNHDINDLVKEPNLQLGVYLPNELLGKLKASSSWLSSANNKSDPIVVVKVYSNDKLFQHSTRSKKLLSRIVSISLPGYSSILPEPLPLILRRTIKNDVNMSGSCHNWNYQYWATDGILTLSQSESKKGVVVCLLRHLAPSAYLIENKKGS